jgi:hypothetical protein
MVIRTQDPLLRAMWTPLLNIHHRCNHKLRSDQTNLENQRSIQEFQRLIGIPTVNLVRVPPRGAFVVEDEGVVVHDRVEVEMRRMGKPVHTVQKLRRFQNYR